MTKANLIYHPQVNFIYRCGIQVKKKMCFSKHCLLIENNMEVKETTEIQSSSIRET